MFREYFVLQFAFQKGALAVLVVFLCLLRNHLLQYALRELLFRSADDFPPKTGLTSVQLLSQSLYFILDFLVSSDLLEVYSIETLHLVEAAVVVLLLLEVLFFRQVLDEGELSLEFQLLPRRPYQVSVFAALLKLFFDGAARDEHLDSLDPGFRVHLEVDFLKETLYRLFAGFPKIRVLLAQFLNVLHEIRTVRAQSH